MLNILEKYLGVEIVFDGRMTLQEGLITAILAVLAVLVIVIIISIVRNAINNSKRKKDAIFSNRKNKYKSRLGKKRKRIK